MHKRTLATLALPLGIAACGELPLEPADAPAAAAVAVAADAGPSLSTFASDGRLVDLATALADAQTRIVPTVSGGEDGTQTPLQAALQLLGDRMAAGDGDGVLEAVGLAEAALDDLAAGGEDTILPELDAVRLMLDEVRASAAAPTTLQ